LFELKAKTFTPKNKNITGVIRPLADFSNQVLAK
jgi:hypothetical protein